MRIFGAQSILADEMVDGKWITTLKSIVYSDYTPPERNKQGISIKGAVRKGRDNFITAVLSREITRRTTLLHNYRAITPI